MFFFVTILQGWAYKTQPTCEMHTSNCSFGEHRYCKDGFTKHNKHARCIDDTIFCIILQTCYKRS